MAKYEFIDSHVPGDSETAPVIDRCRWLEVSTSGFYNWRSRPQSATSKRREFLAQQIRVFFDAAHGTYGYRRIHVDLRAAGVECSPELVRSMEGLGVIRWSCFHRDAVFLKANRVPKLAARNVADKDFDS